MTLTTVNPALLDTQAQYTGFKNRIINGAMVIDQRNGGASVSITGSNNALYTLDRWQAVGRETLGVFSVQQVTDAPTGFANSLKVTVTTADATVTDSYNVQQKIEGFNVADFSFGTDQAFIDGLAVTGDWQQITDKLARAGVLLNATPHIDPEMKNFNIKVGFCFFKYRQ